MYLLFYLVIYFIFIKNFNIFLLYLDKKRKIINKGDFIMYHLLKVKIEKNANNKINYLIIKDDKNNNNVFCELD